MNQITSFKETIAKVLDKDTSLAENTWMMIREQGITKALALLLERLDVKAAEALPGIIRVIISWVLNRAAKVVG